MFDTTAFLRDNFQNPAGVIAFLRAYGCEPPTEAQVQKWFQRDSVPSDWLCLLLGYLEIDRGLSGLVCRYLRASK